MNTQISMIQATVAAVLLALGASAQAAPQEVVKLPRVVIVGKSAAAPVVVAQLPRVVVTGTSVKIATRIAQLPRVVVTGYSTATLLQQQTLAAAKSAAVARNG